MFHIILYQPEIAPNTGNIIRLSANTGCQLHLIRPFGFTLDDKKLRRAGLDYKEFTSVQSYDSLAECLSSIHYNTLYCASTKGSCLYTTPSYKKQDAFLFGPETRGLPATILQQSPEEHVVKLPMCKHSRSLNLSNSVSIFIYEAWRQCEFA